MVGGAGLIGDVCSNDNPGSRLGVIINGFSSYGSYNDVEVCVTCGILVPVDDRISDVGSSMAERISYVSCVADSI